MTGLSQLYQVAIVGGGLAGMSLASLLGQAGVSVCLIDDTPLDRFLADHADGRTTAVSAGSAAILERAGVWHAFHGDNSGAITDIDILDGDSDVLLRFAAQDVGDKPFGHVVDNMDLRQVLFRRVADLPSVTHITGQRVVAWQPDAAVATVTLADGQAVRAQLVVGADGRRSFIRQAMGIQTYGRDYGQTAIVCLVDHEMPHRGLAIERFDKTGPFAILPFAPRTRSALVYCVRHADAAHWMSVDPSIFEAELNKKAAGFYGWITLAGQRAAWPLTLVKAYRYTGPRTVLMAEAAHGMHPVAGQGLNMSLRDCDALANLVIDAHANRHDIGHAALVSAYQRQRMTDNMAMCLATDGLVSLFSNEIGAVRWARRLGLRVVEKIPAAKRFFMRQAMGRLAA